MKKFSFVFFLLITSTLFSQTIPVTFHFRPTFKDFTVLRLVGTMNGWNNADPALEMSDPDADGEYTITIPLNVGTDYMYKFCMDANWGLAFGDPDNPRINTSDNDNAMLLVKDPMITYLLPRDVDSNSKMYVDTSKYGNPIRVIINNSPDNPIDTTNMVVSIDGVPIASPSQYYNSVTGEFIFTPNPPLETGNHTVNASITSAAGNDAKSSTFSRNPNQVIVKVPVDFYYDQNNRTVTFAQTLWNVAAVGSFNNWNDAFHPMSDPSGNGVWETTVMLEPDTIEYKIKLNKISWENDPDYPVINLGSGNNQLAVIADSASSVKLLSPLENTTFQHDTTATFSFLLRHGALSKGIDTTTISVLYEGNPVSFTYHADRTVTANIPLTGEGRHRVDFSFTNLEGSTAHQVYSFGIIGNAKGVMAIDGIGDEQYTYPVGVTSGSADILSVAIRETAGHDSLKFILHMKSVDDRTRIGLLINNPASGFVNDQRQLDIKLPDWNGQGVFASIGFAGNSYHNAAVENRFMISNSPVTYSPDSIMVNADAVATNSIEFTVSLAFLGQHMGGWTEERDFAIWSYLASDDHSGNSVEVGATEGGSDAVEDPDVYDAAFIRSTFWQNRILRNYVPAGTRLAVFDGTGRGLLPLTAAQISDSLANKITYISFLTPGVDYWYSNVTVHGFITDSSITTISFIFNGNTTDHNITGGKFSIPVVLNEGSNTVVVKVVDTNAITTTSKELVMTFTPDKNPAVVVTGKASGRNITLSAKATSPIGQALSYAWSGDAKNPQAISLVSTIDSVSFLLPKVNGEYLFTATVTDAMTNSSFAKIAVKTIGDSIYVASADDNYHADWVDSAVIYEIFPRSFSDQGGFQGITANIAKIKSLGANTVWFMPVFDGPTVHGYEINNYFALESDFGTNADFVNMIAALKQNGIRVILDLVVNHTGIGHPFMQNVFKYKAYSPWADFYLWSGEPGVSEYQYYFNWSSLPNLNHNNPAVRKYFIDVSKYWVEQFGIDGYRCDVAWGVEERNNLFWKEWRTAVKSVNPGAYLLAEGSTADPVLYQKRFDSAYDWDLRSQMINVLNGSNTLGTMHAQVMKPTTPFGRPFRFVENHDETRATAMFDSKRSLLMHTIVFTLNGIPLIYSGAEVGETTQRNMINWTDPGNVHPYFERLVKIRKEYIHNPVIARIQNSDTASIYSYSSVSKTSTIVTVANFKNTTPTVTLDLTTLPYDGSSTYYLTDLFTGAVTTVLPADRKSIPISLTNYQARVLYYGLTPIVVSVVEGQSELVPQEMVLEQNFPNPFNPSTTVRFGLPSLSRVKLQVFNVLGQVVAELVNGELSAGWHETTWNASVSSGIYFCRLETADVNNPGSRIVQVKKMLFMK
ncbi:MAG: alpha-amylase family glycosyl hydrolase [Bacteroidota bacterium]